ncbi:carboxylesterase family protein [Streptococcus pantholopis]|uniref:Carboxylic ester hydrolase n=1 Tax=Streptococcus pantholopis TaxID=1811193 RepID=A0A172QAH8_9STRE|nr:carboxylesterase family protein [Streptococcus pantholopis]AND80422.1 carboxylesterase [Streptococcus pantholopis]
MKKLYLVLLAVLLGFSLTACNNNNSKKSGADFNQSLTQTVAAGKVKGSRDKENKAMQWLGIPYAQAPVGQLRWKEPQKAESWDGTFKADEYGNTAVQLSDGEVVGSEDALNLDVVRPDSKEADLPVVVYIHGGNNQTGSSQEIKGNSFVNDLNAVYVSVNYRLGALGFNPLQALKNGNDNENSGNYSLLDIAAALDWVEENIAAFGGDKNNVTLAGFSAGGRDVMASLISPLFAGKYQKAISFSGGMTLADETESQDIFAEALAPLVVEDQVKETETEAKSWLLTADSQVTDYLYGLSAERLAGLMGNAAIRMRVFPHLYKDGKVLPTEGFETDQYNDVPLLLISGTSEFSLFAAYDERFAADFSDKSLFDDKQKTAEFNYVKKYGGQLYRLSNTVESARILGDSYDSPIYIGEISYGDDQEITPDLAETFGAFHGIFEPLLQTPSNYESIIGKAFDGQGAKDLSADFKAYLKNFLHSDNPNGDDLTKWLQWSPKSESVLSLSADKKGALIEATADTEDAQLILDKMAKDSSLSDDVKEELNSTVLNGRWFSSLLDEQTGAGN